MEILSQMWSLLGLLTVLQNVLPSQLLHLLHTLWQSLQDSLTPFSYFDVPEFIGYCGVDPNDLYRHVHLYLHASLLPSTSTTSTSSTTATSPPRLTLSLPRNSHNLSLTVAPNHAVEDYYNGNRLLWTHHVDTLQDSLDERRSFSLRTPKQLARSPTLLTSYLSHVSRKAEEFERLSRDRRLHTNIPGRSESGCWASVPFRHPATFDTLALDQGLKRRIIADLSAFADGKDFYKRIGRAWKRGYLLHGPPGSGKSSLIAAMANYLRYDVYDLELTKVTDNSELRALLIQTTNRSVIVIEDIDCSLELTGDRDSKVHKLRSGINNNTNGGNDHEDGHVTLSGLLNFTDGLWSCCGEERIIVFTTNHKDGVDPALVRAGRMDVHVRLGTCGIHAFKELVKGYLGVEEHDLFHVAESCIRAGGALTPAEVGEVLLRNRDNVDVAVREVVAEMQGRVLRGGGSKDCNGEESNTGDSDLDEETSPTGSWELGLSTTTAYTRESERKRKTRSTSVSTWEKKVKFLTRLRSLTKSESGRRGV